jgi:hypothetical protein
MNDDTHSVPDTAGHITAAHDVTAGTKNPTGERAEINATAATEIVAAERRRGGR